MSQIHPRPRGYEPPFSGKLWGVTRCEDLPNMTEQAHCAKGINPGDRPPVERTARPLEIGGRQGPEPTRYGDWELRGRCIDF